MIQDVVNSKGNKAISSDHWHVVLSHFTVVQGTRGFVRTVHSEHDTQTECVRAARALRRQLAEQGGTSPEAERDEVFVRRPKFKSLKACKNRRAEPA